MNKPEIVEGDCGLCYGSRSILNDSSQMPWSVWVGLQEWKRDGYAQHNRLKPKKLSCPGCNGTGKVCIEVANTQMAGAV